MASTVHFNFVVTQPCASLCPFSSSSSSNSKFKPHNPFSSSSFPLIPHKSYISLRSDRTLLRSGYENPPLSKTPHFRVVGFAKVEPLKVMISGPPASGKGTQCELITKKYGFVHIAAGDLLRAEVAEGSENGKRAKEYMEKGQLVPNEILVKMVKERLLQPDSLENGWLLDGYPRSLSQAAALQEFGFQPDICILLEVPEEALVERVVGRRLDPVTGKIYHLKYSPPETEEIAARLTQRFDDTEEKVKLRLHTHHQNMEAVLSIYEDITIKVNGNAPKEEVFAQIDTELAKLFERRNANLGSLTC